MFDTMDIIPSALRKTDEKDGDYKRDGILYCGKCHAPKQIRQGAHLLPVMCQCAEQKQDAEQSRKERVQFENRLKELDTRHVTLPGALLHTFDNDDGKNAEISDLCRRYVENWGEFLAGNIGMLFYGSVGTGKSFFASCIVNALRERQVVATVTSFSRLLNILQDTKEKQAFIDGLAAYKMLVLDDLNTERDTSYATEQIRNIIDSRSNTGLPIIVTTNLTFEQLENPPSMQYACIYDRILELCPVRLKMSGESRRKANAEAKKELARKLLK